MNGAVYPTRTQISLSPELKQLIAARGVVAAESLSEYLRKAALVRMALEDMETDELKLVAKAVIGRVAKSKGGWGRVKNISGWQREVRRDEDRHRA